MNNAVKHSNGSSKYSQPTNFGVDNLNQSDIKLVKESLISRCKFNIKDTIESYPCRFSHNHKKTIYSNIINNQKEKDGQINPEQVSYFTRWKQLNADKNTLSTLSEDEPEVIGGNDLNSQFAKVFGKEPVDIEAASQNITDNTESKDNKDVENDNDEQKNDGLITVEPNPKSITIHSYDSL